MVNYYQQGGQAEQDVVGQVIAGLIENPEETLSALMQSEQANEIVQEIAQRAQSGDEEATQAAQVIQQAVEAQQAQAQKAAHGAKLNYIKRLQGIPQEDEQVVYFKCGGKAYSKIVKKSCGGNKMMVKAQPGSKMPKGGSSPKMNEIKKDINAKKKQQPKQEKKKPNNLDKPVYNTPFYKTERERRRYNENTMGGPNGEMAEGKKGMKMSKKCK